MTKTSMGLMAAAALAVLALAGCGGSDAPASTASAVTVTGPGGSAVETDGDKYTSRRAGQVPPRIVISQGPVKVSFEVEGEGVYARVRQGNRWLDVPMSGQTGSVMLGAGGGSQLAVTNRDGDVASVRITSVTPCSDPAAACAPLEVPSSAPVAEEGDAAPAAATP